MSAPKRCREAIKIAAAITGARIEAVHLRPFDNGRGGEGTDPVLQLSTGDSLSFVVDETDVGEYGVLLALTRSPAGVERGAAVDPAAAALRALLPFAVSAIEDRAPYCDAHDCLRLARWEEPPGASTRLVGCDAHKPLGAVESDWARALRLAAGTFTGPEADPVFAEVLARARGEL